MEARKLEARLMLEEFAGKLAPDCRETLRNERFRLTLALRRGEPKAIMAARDEALRVAQMWGVL